jgi:hypothetical protein
MRSEAGTGGRVGSTGSVEGTGGRVGSTGSVEGTGGDRTGARGELVDIAVNGASNVDQFIR